MHHLEVKNLEIKYKDEIILKNLSYSFENKNFYAIYGENGVGKTTLVKTIAGLHLNYNGIINLKNQKIKSECKSHIGWAGASDLGWFMRLSFYDNLKLFFYLKSAQNSFENSIEIWSKISLFKENIYKPVHSSSTGTRHFFSIIRSTLNSPDLIIWDEPFRSLSEPIIDNVFKITHLSCPESLIIFTSHNYQIQLKNLKKLILKKDSLEEFF